LLRNEARLVSDLRGCFEMAGLDCPNCGRAADWGRAFVGTHVRFVLGDKGIVEDVINYQDVFKDFEEEMGRTHIDHYGCSRCQAEWPASRG
jgi:hypothetical protein